MRPPRRRTVAAEPAAEPEQPEPDAKAAKAKDDKPKPGKAKASKTKDDGAPLTASWIKSESTASLRAPSASRRADNRRLGRGLAGTRRSRRQSALRIGRVESGTGAHRSRAEPEYRFFGDLATPRLCRERQTLRMGQRNRICGRRVGRPPLHAPINFPLPVGPHPDYQQPRLASPLARRCSTSSRLVRAESRARGKPRKDPRACAS